MLLKGLNRWKSAYSPLNICSANNSRTPMFAKHQRTEDTIDGPAPSTVFRPVFFSIYINSWTDLPYWLCAASLLLLTYAAHFNSCCCTNSKLKETGRKKQLQTFSEIVLHVCQYVCMPPGESTLYFIVYTQKYSASLTWRMIVSAPVGGQQSGFICQYSSQAPSLSVLLY